MSHIYTGYALLQHQENAFVLAFQGSDAMQGQLLWMYSLLSNSASFDMNWTNDTIMLLQRVSGARCDRGWYAH